MKKIRLSLFRYIQPMDLFGEHFTLGHRLALGNAVQSQKEYEILKDMISALHEVKIKPRHIKRMIKYFREILEKLEKWIEREKQLQYDPTPEEVQAGYNEIGKKLKDFSVVDAIALRMGISHDDALQLPYTTVYMMLLKDLEQSKFERRLQKVYERKHK